MSVCGSRALEGLLSPTPIQIWTRVLRRGAGLSSALLGLALLFAPHFPPSHLPFLSPGLPPNPGRLPLRYCFRVRVTSGVRDLRPGAGPGRAAFTMLLSRGRAAGGAPAQSLPSPQICPPKGKFAPSSCPSSTGLAPSQTDFSKIQIPVHWAPTWSN